MPYIKSKLMRGRLNILVGQFIFMMEAQFNPSFITGNLNYFLFKLAKKSCTNYESYRNFIGELEAAKLEIYRRQIAPYEDKKIQENGDVE